ncbi:MAG: DUF2851 family protein [Bacteroidota bacterium]
MSRIREPLVAESPQVIARVPEAAIQDAWVRGLFTADGLTTTEGASVTIVDRGRLNTDSGPDITHARVVVDGMLWAGDIEIHRTSAEWEAHGHQRDPAYDRVVLHVVLAADRHTGTLRRADGSALPELVLLPHLDRSLRSLLSAFAQAPRARPLCPPRPAGASPAETREWVQSLGLARLRQRAAALGHRYTRRPDLERLLIVRAFRALGYAANADAFEMLAERVDLAWLRQQDADAIYQHLLDASGLQPSTLFEPASSAQTSPPPMRREAWKRGGRPANRPARRLEQAAAWLSPGGPFRSDGLTVLSEALRAGVDDALDVLRVDPPAGHHRLGQSRAQQVLIDAVLPVLLVHSEHEEDNPLADQVIAAYRALPGPDDRVIRSFEASGFVPGSALEAQGLHQLAEGRCDDSDCSRCAEATTPWTTS